MASHRPRPRRFSMIRDFEVADFFTLGNGFAGMGALLAMMRYLVSREESVLWVAFALLPIALVLDVLDGRIARWRRKASLLGQELDSLADLVSFGVAPAALAFTLGMQGAWDIPILLYFVGCGISRLARYNTTASKLSDESGKVRYFEGTPIPSSLAIVALLAVLTSRAAIDAALPLGVVTFVGGRFHPLVLLYLLSGSAMVSKTLRIPKP